MSLAHPKHMVDTDFLLSPFDEKAVRIEKKNGGKYNNNR